VYLPGQFESVMDEFGVKSVSYSMMDMRRIVIVKQAPESTTDKYIHKRKIWRQAWVASWDDDSPMDLIMRDQIFTLYTLQKNFWLQFDDEMTRCKANLFTIGADWKSYFTPTYPIVPYGWEPNDLKPHNGNIFVQNPDGTVSTYWSNFETDNEIGMVEFYSALTQEHKVQMSYTWRSFVRIMECNIRPNEIAQNKYTGTVVFEQIRPDYTTDPWLITLPPDCGDPTEINYTPGSGGQTNYSGGTYGSNSTSGSQGHRDTRHSAISVGGASNPSIISAASNGVPI
jgi:hypothetical protein